MLQPAGARANTTNPPKNESVTQELRRAATNALAALFPREQRRSQIDHQKAHPAARGASNSTAITPNAKLPPIVSINASWPQQMRRELAFCRTPLEYLLWAEKWADYVSGRVADRARASRQELLRQRPGNGHRFPNPNHK